MRSVNRGPWPTDNNGCRIPFTKYKQAEDRLTERIGEYCSYCERRLSHNVHVEHVVPKSIAPDLETEWDNLLLACTNCNSCKNNRNHSRDGYLWPDRDNTFSAFVYQSSGLVSVNQELAADEHRKASALFDLVGLGKRESTDKRRRQRRQAWGKAIRARDRGYKNNSRDWRDWAVDVALDTGFFSIWMAIFHDDEDMRRRLIEAFPGTRA